MILKYLKKFINRITPIKKDDEYHDLCMGVYLGMPILDRRSETDKYIQACIERRIRNDREVNL